MPALDRASPSPLVRALRSAWPAPLALGAVGVLGAVFVVFPALFAWPAIGAVASGSLVGPCVVLIVVVGAVLVERGRAEPDVRWAEHGLTARVALWAALLIGVPGHFTFAWLRAADGFCF